MLRFNTVLDISIQLGFNPNSYSTQGLIMRGQSSNSGHTDLDNQAKSLLNLVNTWEDLTALQQRGPPEGSSTSQLNFLNKLRAETCKNGDHPFQELTNFPTLIERLPF